MVTLPPDIAQRPGLMPLIELLGGGESTRIVGGAVRDALLELPVSDVDLATRLRPDDVLARLDAGGIKGVPTGIAHGTVTAITAAGPVEVTTLRHDVATDGRHAIIAFADDWREDAARRDFTINALYVDAASGAVFDWFGGLEDLAARRVRFIGDPLKRIAEDHLRILRFFRFHARFGTGASDTEGLAACAARANDLMALSRERIAAELLKLLGVSDPVPTIATMIAHGVFAPVLPEIVDAAPLARLVGREAEAGLTGDAIRRLAALLPPDPELATRIAGRLRLSKADTKRLTLLASRPIGRAEELAYRYGPQAARDALLLGDGDARSVGDRVPVLPVKGGDLIKRGIEAGPKVAAALKRIEDDWVEARFPEGDALAAIVERAVVETD